MEEPGLDIEEELELVEAKTSRLEFIAHSIVYCKGRIEISSGNYQSAQESQQILQALCQQVQHQAHNRICSVVSTCLSTVFDNPYTFHINFEQKRGRTEAELVFKRKGLEVDPMTATGGGMVDVAAFALRVSCLMLHQPPLSRVLVLDEPFRFVSGEFQDNVRTMMQELAEELGIQFVMVTHNRAYETGKLVIL
ncbi:MAG: hypothetical protein Unbinned3891contig1000_7 [Prokaryotic dsDNA virus sp.]|nr:MAG: hypothetical protein Unbinned3891contig1000_7 [Prokaryotic dsDNA virus sp.]|tara:strand:+ start:23172 stop:23753 length:582 start_codon:yes stop_codon:yes gene_type:complete